MGETGEFERLEGAPLRRLARSDFLRLAGAGAGLFVLPAYLSALGSRSIAQTTAGVANIAGGEYPIGIWWPPPPSETTFERYAEISAAGFNFVIGGNGVNDDATNPAALDAAAANGLRFLLTDRTLHRIIRNGAGASKARTGNTPTGRGAAPSVLRHLLAQDAPRRTAFGTASAYPAEETRARTRELLERYGGHPALAGLNLYDEPHKKMFGLVSQAQDVMRKLDPARLPYVNIWPSYASADALGTATYEAYLERYLEAVAPQVLSFDHYPLLSEGRVTADYFLNHARIRKFARRFGVPSWAFIQSMGFDGREAGLARRRKPDEQELLWQANMSLAYGAKGIQYFTYWTPASQPGGPIRFGQALISGSGERTPMYDAAGRVNGYLRVVGRTLLPLVSESVVHAGEKNPPRGAKPFQKDGYVVSRAGSPVVLGRFRDPAGGVDRHLLVANRSFLKRADARLKLSGRVSRVLEVDRTTGEPLPVALRGDPPRYLPVALSPGAARLYMLRTG